MGTSVQPIIVRFQSSGQQQVQAAFKGLASGAQTTGTAINRTFVDGGGKVTAFGRQSVQALNATGFAASQFATTGTASFRSLASATAGFASFFGAGGLIASGVISLGLVLSDFWNRQRREIEETRQKASDFLKGSIDARRERDTPVAVAEERLATAGASRRAAQEGMAPLIRARQTAINDAERRAADAAIERHGKVVAQALKEETEALRLVNDAQNKKAEGDNKEVSTLAAAISARQANNSQLERANMLMGQARVVIEATKNASVEDTATMARRGEAIKTLTALTEAFKSKQTESSNTEVQSLAAAIAAREANNAQIARATALMEQARATIDATRDASVGDTAAMERRAKAIKTLTTLSEALGGVHAQQVSQLAALHALDKQTGADLVQLATLYRTLNAELLTGNVSLERRVELESQLAMIRKVSLRAPDLRLTPTADRAGPLLPGERPQPGRNGSATRLEAPSGRLAQQLSADAIAAARAAGDAASEAASKAFKTAELERMIADTLGNAIASGIASGFVQGFANGGIAEGFQQLTAQLLSGLGNAAISFALASVEIAGIMEVITKAFASLNPWVVLAAGVALAALGTKLGGAARQSFSGGSAAGFGGGVASSPIDIRRLVVDPNLRQPVRPREQASPFTGRPLVANSPEGQRFLAEQSTRYHRRGG